MQNQSKNKQFIQICKTIIDDINQDKSYEKFDEFYLNHQCIHDSQLIKIIIQDSIKGECLINYFTHSLNKIKSGKYNNLKEYRCMLIWYQTLSRFFQEAKASTLKQKHSNNHQYISYKYKKNQEDPKKNDIKSDKNSSWTFYFKNIREKLRQVFSNRIDYQTKESVTDNQQQPLKEAEYKNQ